MGLSFTGSTVTINVNAPTVATGRMTGGGTGITAEGIRVSHGFELHCDPSRSPNTLEVNWGKGHKFFLDGVVTAVCSDNPDIAPNQSAAGFDTYRGTGTGRYDGVAGATVEWTFTDAGEPGTKDTLSITIKDNRGDVVLQVSGYLASGNHQAHKNNMGPQTNSAPLPMP